MVGSGGGGGGSPALPSDTVFLTQDPGLDQPGDTQTFNLTGSATDNSVKIAITATITASRLANQMLNGEEVEVGEVVIVINIPSQGSSVSSVGTSYISLDGVLRQSVDSDGVVCIPDAGFKPFPSSVMVGQSGNQGTLSCSDGGTETSTYLVETSTKNNQWAAVREFSTSMSSGLSDIFVEIVTHITTDGRTRAIEAFVSDDTISFELTS